MIQCLIDTCKFYTTFMDMFHICIYVYVPMGTVALHALTGGAHLLITWWILIYEYLTPLSTHFLSIKRLMLTVSSSDYITSGIYLTLILYTASRILQITINTLRPRQNCRHFADDILKCIFLNENVWIPIKFSLKCVPKGPINNNPALVQIMAWHQPGDNNNG